MGAKWNYTLLALLAFVFTKAQVNLVYNGGFELHNSCPDFCGQINRCIGWTDGGQSVDYFNKCSPSLFDSSNINLDDVGVPNNFFGFSYPKSGDAYIGLFTGYPPLYVDSIGVPKNHREWARGTLIDSLVKDTTYIVKLSISKPEHYSYISNNIGVLFTEQELGDIATTSSINDSVFDNFDNNYLLLVNEAICDTTSWHEFSFLYKANGGEKFINIGNFKTDSLTDFTFCYNVQFGNWDYDFACYYFIDDVSVVRASGLGIEEKPISKIDIYPNPAFDFVSIELPPTYTKAQLSIYNLIGQLISQKQLTQPSQTIPIPELVQGMYLFVVQSGAEVIGRQRVVVAR